MNITLKNAQKYIDKRTQALSVERDKLTALIAELEFLHDKCEEAYYDLERAREALSEVV